MLARDDGSLAIDQLHGAGRADDPQLADARRLDGEPPQEHAAVHAEPILATPGRLRDLRQQVHELQAQLQALPERQLQRMHDLDERVLSVTGQRERLAERLAELPQPRRRLGREHDSHAVERASLTTAILAGERELHDIHAQRSRLELELGDPQEIRAERDGLERALAQSMRELTTVRDALAERELESPAAWVRDTFGERPTTPAAREAWERAVRQVARHRVQYEITDDAAGVLGPRPEPTIQRRDRERAKAAMDRAEQRGRDMAPERSTAVEIDF